MPDHLQGAPIVCRLRPVERATVSIPIRYVRPSECRKSDIPAYSQSPNRKGDLRLPCFGIVDSGADFCAFPMSFAYTLGLNPLNQTPWRWVRRPGPDLPSRCGPRIPYPRRVSTASRFYGQPQHARLRASRTFRVHGSLARNLQRTAAHSLHRSIKRRSPG